MPNFSASLAASGSSAGSRTVRRTMPFPADRKSPNKSLMSRFMSSNCGSMLRDANSFINTMSSRFPNICLVVLESV